VKAFTGRAVSTVFALVCSAVCAASLHAADQLSPAQANPPEPLAGLAKCEPRIIHPPVSMAGFSREYRPLPLEASENERKILAGLEKPVGRTFDFQGTPLRAVLDQLQKEFHFPIVPDRRALEDAGVGLDVTLMTAKIGGVSLRSALNHILREFGLTWIIADETLTVTTKEKAYERPMVVAYPLPRAFGDSRAVDFQTVIDLIHSTVAPDAWDTVGGPGAIRPMEQGGDALLVVSQTSDVHGYVEKLLRVMHERNLAEFAAGKPVVRVHHLVSGRGVATDLSRDLVTVCNGALGDAGDPDATLTVMGDSVAVLSKSPEFHALAAQVVAAVGGVTSPDGTALGGAGFLNGGGMELCWVAREVYGVADPRWLVFRRWMLADAPAWLRAAYGRWGATAAEWLRERPAAKAAVRAWMDHVLRTAAAGA